MFGDRKPFPLFPNETYDHVDGRVSPNECPGRAHFFFRSAGQFVITFKGSELVSGAVIPIKRRPSLGSTS